MTGNSIIDFLFSFVLLVVASYSMFSIKDLNKTDEKHFKLPVNKE
ncbi:hypothetical protein P9X10_00330 [Bacillus cereus]|nr:hypothetical protein [Bacillus cereus]